MEGVDVVADGGSFPSGGAAREGGNTDGFIDAVD